MSDGGISFPSVKELRKKFEPQIAPVQIAPDLKDYLNKVWELRNESDPDLYKVYVGGRPHDPDEDDDWEGWNENQATEFFNDLKQLKRPSLIQEYGWLPDIRDDPGYVGLDTYGETLRSSQISMDDWLSVAQDAMKSKEKKAGGELVFRDLARSFFHYRKEDEQAAWRVYLHVLPKHRGKVAAHLVKNVLPIEGVTNLKVTGPPSKGLDNVVIYHKDQKGVEGTLRAIAAYQKQTPSAFGDETVSLARKETEVDGVKVRGVAVAVEPYLHASRLRPGENWRPSFGDFWEVMLKPILKRNRQGARTHS
jgi:hypothetical protein